MERIEKVWGCELWLENCDKYCLKKLVLLQGRASSLHKHLIKQETFVIESGFCELELLNLDTLCYESRTLHSGDSQRILPLQTHRFYKKSCGCVSAICDCHCVILEVSTHHDDLDVIRLEGSKVLDGRV